MIVLLGASGYVGSAFSSELNRRALAFVPVSRSDTDYTDRDTLVGLLRQTKATFLVNAAGYAGKPNVDACEYHKAECLSANAVLPGSIREACELAGNIPWGHVSSGCIYTGSRPDGSGFTELDPPNFCFRSNNCSFYSGCKALGEECLIDAENVFLWRMRIPFNNVDSSRNYLSKLTRYTRLLEATNSITHLDEFVRACIDCWIGHVPFGTYNVTNSGFVTTRRITELMKQHLVGEKEFLFFDDESQFMQLAAKAPRSNCVLDNSKLVSTGIIVSDVEDAVVRSLKQWQPQEQK